MTSDEKYERLKKDYNDFVYVVSHDFKAAFRKLHSLTGWIKEDLEDGEMDEVQNHIELIQSTTKHLDGMLDGLTWLSRVDRIEDQPAPQSLSELYKEVAEEVDITGLNVKFEGNIPSIISPKEKLFKIVRELLKNAKMFNSKDSKEIEISVDRDGETTKIHFKDNGDGISNKDIEMPFKLFYNEKFKTGIESTGYGLTYARKLAESEGGNIFITNTSESGTTMTLNWPSDKIQQ